MEVTATSRRGNVATSARVLHPSILKYEWLRNRGIGRRTKRGTNLQKQSDTDFERVPGIVSLFIFFWIFLDIKMMFLILDIFIFSFIMF